MKVSGDSLEGVMKQSTQLVGEPLVWIRPMLVRRSPLAPVNTVRRVDAGLQMVRLSTERV